MDFFTTIVDAAHKGVVTGDMFAPFIGRENWLAFTRGEGELGDPGDDVCSGVVYKFTLHAVHGNTVDALVEIDSLVKGGTLMRFDADELAIRMDES
jgi:hypothetical protein